MQKFDYLIIGGSAAGTTAAENIRNLDVNSSIGIITEEPYRLYSRILLPHYLKDRIPQDRLFLKTPQFYEEKNITLITSKRVIEIKPKEKKIRTSDGQEFSYNKLLLATGGKVNKWEVPGVDAEVIFYLRTYEDGINVREAMKRAKKAVVIGGGFISLEFTTSFILAGIDTTILVRDDYYWSNILDEASGNLISSLLEKNGARVLEEEEVERLESSSAVKNVVTKKGTRLETDLIGVGIGIHIDLDYLQNSGIETNKGILTNEYLETNAPNVFAAGDAAEFNDVLFARRHMMGNWLNAKAQGETIAKTMTGTKTIFETASTYSINFFDNNVSFVGVVDSKAADNIIVRGSTTDSSSGRILLAGGRIIGATLINHAKEQAALANLVKKKVDVSAALDKLKDTNFDLHNLLG